ncbi:Ig-like domain-containing protein [Kribbella deserti]|uniref:Ig-like domain-containing protein n=1 Tax=Kribbella deserti TaxID=1926257 RepID=A0ABV6QZD1_9ACTN
MYLTAGARRRRALIAAAAALGLIVLGASPAAMAYQVPDTAFTQGATSGTGTMPGSALTQTISTTGKTGILAATTAGARGTTAATYSPGIATTTPAQDIIVNTGDCASTGTCSNRGTVTITFSQPVLNPILHMAGIGGVSTESVGGTATAQSELHAIFTLATAGVTLSKASTGNNLAVTSNTITATNHDTSPSCISTSTGTGGPAAGATAACGSVQVTGLVTSLTFNMTAIFTKNPSLPAHNQASSGDGISIVASVGQDFGDAPASYDAGNAARAVLSNLKLGSTVTEDNQNVANSATSPNAGASATGDGGDDGVTLTPILTTATTYSATVALSGATKPGQVCGWIDFNKSGTFQVGERACAAVASGQTSATLTWPGLSGLTAGATYARFRVGYTTAQVQSPTGASDSGEVEDYPFTIVAPQPPTATPDTDTTPQDVNVTVNPLTNDAAGTGAVLVPGSVVLRDPADGTFKKTVTIPGEGTYTVAADGQVTFDPLPAFTGTATPVTYRVADNAGQTATSTITITVAPVKPDAVNDTETTPFNTPITVGVLTNDKPGHPSAPLVPDSVCIVSGANCVKTLTTPQGSYTVNANGTITFDPADGYTGTTPPITYRVADDNGTTDTATLVITVPAPGKPAATPDTDTTKQDVNVTVNPLTNDTAGTGAVLVPGSVCFPAGDECVKTLTVPGEGTYTVQPNGTVVFDPLPSFTGEAKPVPYRVSDNAGQTATSTITITVTPIKPDAVNDTNTTPYNTPVTTSVLTNDKPGDPTAPLVPASVCIVVGTECEKTRTVPDEGTYTVNPDGTIKFDPVPGFTGPTTPITYRVTDDNGSTDTATLIITVTLPAPPVAVPDEGTTPQNVNITISPLGNDSASPGVTLVPGSVVLRDPADGTFKKTVTIPGEGTYTVQPDGKVVFDPLPQFTGPATSIGYRVTDTTGQTAESTIAITVTPVTPEAVSDSRTTPYKTPVTIPVLENDKPGSDTTSLNPASVCIVDGTECVKTLTVPGEGTYAVNPDGTVKFTPVDGFRGTTTSVTYEVKDSNGTPTRAQITVSVEAPAPPVANPDENTTPQGQLVNTGVLGNDQPGPTGSPLVPGSVCLVDGDTCGKTRTVPGEGTYTVKDNGSIDFQPVPGFTGEAKPVDYRVTDGNGANASSTLTITVTPVKPDAVDDSATTPYDTPITVPLLGNDNPGNPAVPLVPGSVCLISGDTCVKTLTVPDEGTYTVNPDGSIKFDPLPTFTGKATPQTYRVADENGTTATAVVTITVTPPPAPEAKPDTGTTPQNVNITVSPLTNDEAGTGTTLVPGSLCLISGETCVKTLTVPGEGTYTVAPDGKVTFDPLPTFTGEAKPVPYRVTDSLGRTATSTITITVTPITPQAVDDKGTTPHDTPVTVPVLTNDDPGAPTVPLVPGSVCLVAGDECLKTRTVPGEGTYTVNPDGSIKFDPLPTFSGPATPVTYRVSDENGTTDTAKLTITVGEAPDADPDNGTTPQNVDITVDPLTNDKPGTGADLVPGSVCLVDGGDCVKTWEVPGEGTYTVAPDGKVTFDPLPSFTGTATPVTYQVKDTDGLTATSTIGITVTPIKPTAVDDATTTPFDTPVTVPVLGNDKPGADTAPLVPGSVKLKDPADGEYKATVTVPGEGTYTVDPNGSVTFTPVNGFEGVTTPLTYQVEDGNGTPATALLTVTVGDAPDANPDTGTTKQNVNVTVDPLTNDKPGSGATLVPGSVQVFDEGTQTWGKTATVPGEGKYTVDPVTGQITFDPEPGFTGQSSVPYRVSDSDKHTAASTVTITVAPIKPVATDDLATTPFNTPVTVPVVANDKAGDPSAPLVPSSVMLIDPATGSAVSTLKVPGEGTFTVQPDGGIRFVPEPGFTGTTTPVTYRISDTNGTPTTATLTVTIGVKPVAVPDTKTTKQDVPVTVDPLANDKPGGGAKLDPSTLCLISAGKCVQKLVVPGEGTYTVKDGKVVFDPLPDFTGKATPVTYEVKDSNGNPARSTIGITVTPIRPDAVDDVRKTPFNTPITVGVLGNDKAGDSTAPLVPGSVCLVSGTKCVKTLTVPGEGKYVVNANGTITFTPVKGFTGQTQVPYRVTDANGSTAKATLTITVGKPGGAKAEPDSGNGRPGKPIVINPLANDKPSTGAMWKPGTVCLITSTGDCVKKVVVPDVGTWTVQKDGTVRFVSDPDYTGTARIGYRVTDTDGVTVESRITIKVGDQPAPPPDDEEELPDTGGPSTLFFTLGALLVAMGGALLMMARRRRP